MPTQRLSSSLSGLGSSSGYHTANEEQLDSSETSTDLKMAAAPTSSSSQPTKGQLTGMISTASTIVPANEIPSDDEESNFEPEADNADSNKICENCLLFISIVLFILTFPFSMIFAIKVIAEYKRAVIFRLGHLKSKKPHGPGIFFILPCIDKFILIDLRSQARDVEPQEILTKESVTVAVDAVVYYRVVHPILAVVRVADYDRSINLVSTSLLRHVLGTQTLTQLLSDRDTLQQHLQSLLHDVASNWGIVIERVEIKNIQLPIQLQRSMATEAEAAREALARVISAEGEEKASHALKEAADIINQSPGALQLRYLQTLASVSSEKSSTIIFPVPIELLNLLPANFWPKTKKKLAKAENDDLTENNQDSTEQT